LASTGDESVAGTLESITEANWHQCEKERKYIKVPGPEIGNATLFAKEFY